MISAPRCSRGAAGAWARSASKARRCAAGGPDSAAAGRQMRRQAYIGDSLPGHCFQHLDRLSHRPGAVVHGGKQVRVQIDHAPTREESRMAVASSSRFSGASLRLRQQCESDQGIAGKQIEGAGAIGGMGKGSIQRGLAGRDQGCRERWTGRGVGILLDPGSKRRREPDWCAGPASRPTLRRRGLRRPGDCPARP